MKKRVDLAVVMALLGLLCVACAVGCGGGGQQGDAGAPSAAEVGAPVYPGARYAATGSSKGTFKYTSVDLSAKIVDWYREKLKGESGFKETNEFEEAVTGDAINYTDGDKNIWITILPGMEDLPTTIEISVNPTF